MLHNLILHSQSTPPQASQLPRGPPSGITLYSPRLGRGISNSTTEERSHHPGNKTVDELFACPKDTQILSSRTERPARPDWQRLGIDILHSGRGVVLRPLSKTDRLSQVKSKARLPAGPVVSEHRGTIVRDGASSVHGRVVAFTGSSILLLGQPGPASNLADLCAVERGRARVEGDDRREALIEERAVVLGDADLEASDGGFVESQSRVHGDSGPVGAGVVHCCDGQDRVGELDSNVGFRLALAWDRSGKRSQ